MHNRLLTFIDSTNQSINLSVPGLGISIGIFQHYAEKKKFFFLLFFLFCYFYFFFYCCVIICIIILHFFLLTMKIWPCFPVIGVWRPCVYGRKIKSTAWTRSAPWKCSTRRSARNAKTKSSRSFANWSAVKPDGKIESEHPILCRGPCRKNVFFSSSYLCLKPQVSLKPITRLGMEGGGVLHIFLFAPRNLNPLLTRLTLHATTPNVLASTAHGHVLDVAVMAAAAAHWGAVVGPVGRGVAETVFGADRPELFVRRAVVRRLGREEEGLQRHMGDEWVDGLERIRQGLMTYLQEKVETFNHTGRENLQSFFANFPIRKNKYKAKSPSWNRGVPMASRRGQILLAVFILMPVLPIRLATVSTQVLFQLRDFAFYPKFNLCFVF